MKRRLGPPRMDETHIVFDLLHRDGPGLMIDVGAHFGESLIPFADAGWTVHAFEPDSANRTALERAAAPYERVHVLPDAVSDVAGERQLFRSPASSGISSLASFHESHAATEVVPTMTLASYVADARIGRVDFLKIDVEGFEREVLGGYDWSLPPRAVVAEFEDSKSVPRGYDWTDLARTFQAHGLRVLVSEWYPIESYGAVHRWRRFAEYPCALADRNAWGNLIAVEPGLWPRLRLPKLKARMMTAAGRSLARIRG